MSRVRIAAVVALAAGAVLGLPGGAEAATASSIYSYTLTGGSGTVANAAAANPAVPLTLTGAWTASAYGVHFAGDLAGTQSVGWAKPTSGTTVSVAANQSLGAAIRFRYSAPPPGSTCFADSHNLTQVGRYGDGLSQLKIQLSNCGDSAANVYVQCRVAGAATTPATTQVPKQSTLALLDGQQYVVRCVKAPDTATGAPLTLKVTRLVAAPTTVSATFTVPATGAISSTAALSVANKYPLPAPAANTDQFVGDVAKVAYCAGGGAVVGPCLDTEVPPVL